jgi:hypothetical protein
MRHPTAGATTTGRTTGATTGLRTATAPFGPAHPARTTPAAQTTALASVVAMVIVAAKMTTEDARIRNERMIGSFEQWTTLLSLQSSGHFSKLAEMTPRQVDQQKGNFSEVALAVSLRSGNSSLPAPYFLSGYWPRPLLPTDIQPWCSDSGSSRIQYRRQQRGPHASRF